MQRPADGRAAEVVEVGRRSDFLHVRGLQSLRPARDFEFDLVALSAALEALALHGAVMDEDVLAALLRDEPVALGVVEPLHMSLCHSPDLSLWGRRPGILPLPWRGYLPELEGKEKAPCEMELARRCVSVTDSFPTLKPKP